MRIAQHSLVALLALACRPAAPAPALEPAPEPAPAIALQAGILGTHSWPVTTQSAAAQAWFDQGLRLMYGYARDEARLSFEQARRADPACAMCWWGEAWSAGSYLNQPMPPADAPAAWAALQRARELASGDGVGTESGRSGDGVGTESGRGRREPPTTPGTTDVERALIGALAARYAPVHPAGGRRGLDSAYANAMADVHARFPTHDEVTTLYADALMLLEPRRGTWPMSKPSVPRIHALLEEVLARNIRHPGACHAYIHATETTPNVGKAQACADHLGASIPAVSHVNHMPSHTYNRVGRWADATRANLEAVETDRRAGRGEGYAIYPAHNLHMLFFSSAIDGQEAVSVQAANDFRAMVGVDGASFQALALVRFGRFGEVLALTDKPQHPVHEGLWAFARGLAHLRGAGVGTESGRGGDGVGTESGRGGDGVGDAPRDSARAWLARVDSLATHTPPTTRFRHHEPGRLLGVVGNLLRGEILRSEGRTDDAIAAFRVALALEQGLAYDEPEPLPFMAYEFLGHALLATGCAAEAVEVYQASLVARPNSGWTLHGLERALRAAGRGVEADGVRQRFAQAWARSEADPAAMLAR